MKIIRLAREKLVEKDIKWKEVYTDKTEFLKEQFEDIIGPGSYFRFEGKDRDSGDEYYCVIGPAKVHKPKAKWFAGVRKLPATYSAGGKYFDSMDGAATYARETWGVPTPKTLKPYTAAALFGISSKINKWKEDREEHENETDSDGEDKESLTTIEMGKIAQTIPRRPERIAPSFAPTKRKTRERVSQFNIDQVINPKTGKLIKGKPYQSIMDSVINDPVFQSNLQALSRSPKKKQQLIEMKKKAAENILKKGYDEKISRAAMIAEEYGIPENFAQSLEHVFVSYYPGVSNDSGITFTAIGPYTCAKNEDKSRRQDVFGKYMVHTWKKRNASEDAIMRLAYTKAKAINEKYQLEGTTYQILPSDFGYVLGGYGDDPENRLTLSSLGDMPNPSNDPTIDKQNKTMEQQRRQLFQVAPVEGDQAKYFLNDSGLNKLSMAMDERGASEEEKESVLKSYREMSAGQLNWTETKADTSGKRELEFIQAIIPELDMRSPLRKSDVDKWIDIVYRNITKSKKKTKKLFEEEMSQENAEEAIKGKIREALDSLAAQSKGKIPLTEIWDANKAIVDKKLDSTSFETEEQAFNSANLTNFFDPKFSMGIHMDRMVALRNLRLAKMANPLLPPEERVDLPDLDDDQIAKVLTMSDNIFNRHYRNKFDLVAQFLQKPEVQEILAEEFEGAKGVHVREKGLAAHPYRIEKVKKPEEEQFSHEQWAEEQLRDIEEFPVDVKPEWVDDPFAHPESVPQRVRTDVPSGQGTPGYRGRTEEMERLTPEKWEAGPEEDDLTEEEKALREYEYRTAPYKRRRQKSFNVNLSEVYSNTLGNLIKIAKKLDDEGKYSAAEEVHKVIRKYKNWC